VDVTDTEILDQLTQIFRDVFGDDTIVARPDMSAEDIPEWDSMNHITIIAQVEADFRVRFKTAEIEEMRNVNDLIRAIREKKK
jgi:acyl carrier protein